MRPNAPCVPSASQTFHLDTHRRMPFGPRLLARRQPIVVMIAAIRRESAVPSLSLQLAQMIRHPLEDRVDKQQVGVRRRNPMRDVGFDKCVSWQPGARLPQHVGGCINLDDLGLRPALDQQFGGITGTAADIDGLARRAKWNLS